MQRKYQTVKDMFENHFVKCRNKNSRAGRACRRLYCCSLCLCQYGNLREETIWDQIVVGILDGRLEKLKLDPELTLEKAVTQARQSKAVKKQQGTVHEGNAEQPPANAPAGVDESEGLQQDRESLWCQHVAGVGEVHPTLSSSATSATRKDIFSLCAGARGQCRSVMFSWCQRGERRWPKRCVTRVYIVP